MGTVQTETLNVDADGKATSGHYGDLGDGTDDWHNIVRVVDGGNEALGSTTDAASSGNGSIIAILKYIRGIFKAEDSVAVSGDLGLPALGARNDTLASNASATGDYALPSIGSGGEMFFTLTPPQATNQAVSVALATAANTTLATNLVVKASPGTLYNLVIHNNNASARYLQIHNATSLPADGAIPIIVYSIPAGGTIVLDLGVYGLRFTIGITACFSTTLATKTIAGADMWMVATYK